MLAKLVFFSFILLLPSFLKGQSYLGKVQHYGIEEGLSHRDVQCIHQDKQGFLWLGTKYGLNRFDGKNFKWYTKEQQGLQSNEINHILEDKKGLLWLINTGSFIGKTPLSIDIFDLENEKIISFEDYFKNQIPFSLSNVINFDTAPSGAFVFLTKDNNLIFYDGHFQVVPLPLKAYYKIQDIHWGPNNWIWLVIRGLNDKYSSKILTLQAFDLSGKEMQGLSHPAFDFGFIYHFEEDGNISYLISRNDPSSGIQAFQTNSSGKSIPDLELQKIITSNNLEHYDIIDLNIINFHNGLFWISTGNEGPKGNPNLKVFNKTGSIDIQWETTFNEISHITDFLHDNFGNTWVSTQFGISQLQLKENHFTKLLHHTDGENRPTRSILLDLEDNLWVVEEAIKDFWKINLNTQESVLVNKNLPPEEQIPINNSFVTLANGNSNQFYFSYTQFLVEINPLNLENKIRDLKDPMINGNSIWAIYEDDFGKIWLTNGRGGIGYCEDQKFQWLPAIENLSYAYQFFKDRNGKTWLVTDGGLFVLDMEKGEIIERFWTKGKSNHHFPFDNLYHVHEDSSGAFWIGTGGNGLVHWEKPGIPNTWNQYTKAHGLSNNSIYAVYSDDFHNLWLSSDYGLMRFNKKTKRSQAFLESDGITHREFNRISHYQAPDGTLFFGGLNGVTQFHPKDFKLDSTKSHPPLVITNYQHYDASGALMQEKKASSIIDTGIVFQPSDRLFYLEFELLSYQDVSNTQYAYKIEGLDRDWIYQKENVLRFSRLPYGIHTLRIKGQAGDGQWSNKELAIKVKVLRPFYLKTWFLILGGFILVSSMIAFFQLRIRYYKNRQLELEKVVAQRTQKIQEDKEVIEHQAQELKSLERLKSRFFANVSHELRTPLTLLLGPVNSLIKDKKESSKDYKLLHFIKRNSNQLLKLINEILDLSKLESGKLELNEEPIHLHKYLERLIAQFQSFAESESVKFKVDYQADEALIIMMDKDKVEKIIQNYLSNAMKFSPLKGEVILRIKDQNEHIELSVYDEGPGVHPDDLPNIFDRFYQSRKDKSTPKGGTGIGLSLVKELAELMNGRVWAESVLGKGSVFYFEFPKKAAVNADLSLVDFGQLEKEPSLLKESKPKFEKAINLKEDLIPPTADNPQKTTILLVEDNPDLRKYIKMLLSDYNVLTAENGKAGLDCLLETSMGQAAGCQLIISDLMMPVMDGFEFLENIKSDDRWRHIPVIMLTAKVNAKAKLKALRIGVDDYLNKPFMEEELKARIENLLSNYKVRMELFSKNGKDEKGTIKPVIAEADAKWLAEVEAVLHKMIPEYNLTMDKVAAQMYLSSRQLSRKIKKLTGLTASQYLQEMRLQQAKEFLSTGKYLTVKEVSKAVGFAKSRYFSDLFKKHFGNYPSSLLP